ncbi:MAG: hypothetical protein IPM24_24700 [Bryobacterales bacterium]|jgi:hypothetical protein|nr:hypothetical protein [Bryobacterales bacterium]
MTYESILQKASVVAPGVTLVIAKMSFARRLELATKIREIAARLEYLNAGDGRERMEAAILTGEVERLYVQWGLKEIIGLLIDGEPATPDRLIDNGPEELFREALEAVKSECSLSEAERKN